MSDMKKRWKHKETGKEYNVLPWWECESDLIEKKDCPAVIGDKEDEWKDRLSAIGVLYQIGWLIENEHGVWFGVGPKAKDSFDEISA
jgi:hypothetical protein